MRLTRVLLIAATAIGLSGCFVSKTPLIGDEQSAAPYQKIVYGEADDDEVTTLNKEGSAYMLRADGNEVEVRFTDVGEGAYVAQLRSTKEGETAILYAYLKVDVAGKTAEAYKVVAEKEDAGPGLSRCATENEVCIESIKAYADHARSAIAAGAEPDTTYRIITLE
jgi:hypothetical protein